MEKIEEKEVARISRTHKFYCDKCNKYLGQSEEYDDGWYKSINEREWNVCIDKIWYYKRANLCDECFKEINNNIIKTFQKLDFHREE